MGQEPERRCASGMVSASSLLMRLVLNQAVWPRDANGIGIGVAIQRKRQADARDTLSFRNKRRISSPPSRPAAVLMFFTPVNRTRHPTLCQVKH